MTFCSCGQGIKDMNGSRVIEDADASGVPEPMDTGASKILTENRESQPRSESKWPAWRCFGWRQWGISLIIPARCGGNHGDHNKVEEEATGYNHLQNTERFHETRKTKDDLPQRRRPFRSFPSFINLFTTCDVRW
jgi:hypothetical protein